MPIYNNNNRFTPGKKSNSRVIINRTLLLKQYYGNANYDDSCGCIPEKFSNINNGWNNPFQNKNIIVSQMLSRTLGGKLTFGDHNNPVVLNYLGGKEGQPGGLPKPLRNKF
jgi:hypothetical protein